MIQVLRKAAAVLSHLAEEGELTVVELAVLTKEPKTSVYRLLNSLQALEFVEPGARRASFRLGLKVLELGSGVLRRYDVREAALPLLQSLHDETEETIFLCVRDGGNAVCIEKIDGKWVRTMEVGVGGILPLHRGAVCRALLAFEDEAFWEQYVSEHNLVGRTTRSPQTAGELYGLLREVRRNGYAIADGETVVGLAAIGAPIFDAEGNVHAAISISGPSPALLGENRDQLIQKVVGVARTVSQALGYRGAPSDGGTAPNVPVAALAS